MLPITLLHAKQYSIGAIGGLIGGLVFGAMMSIIGMMPKIAALVGSGSASVGWIVHLIISMTIGLFFVWWFGTRVYSYGDGARYGVLHGFIWWIAGPSVLMPLLMGMGAQFGSILSRTNLMSLLGHLVFGLLLGLVYAVSTQQRVRAASQA